MKKEKKTTKINGLEASAILHAFDRWYDTGQDGKVNRCPDHIGLKREELQRLRDKLFRIHEHS